MAGRVVAERRDVFDKPEQGWLEHMQESSMPVHDTPEGRRVKECQYLRNGVYSQSFGEEKSLENAYRWSMENGWVWCISFPLIAIHDLAESDEEFERIFKIVFSTAGKNELIEPFAIEGMRSWLDVLINCAGIMDDNTAVGDMSDEMMERLFRINTYGPLYAMRKAVRTFLAQGDGGWTCF